MKKIFLMIISIALMLNSAAFADSTARYHTVTHNLNISGNLGTEYAGENAFLILVDKNVALEDIPYSSDKIKYIDSGTVDESGNFSGKVKIDNDMPDNLKVYIKCGDNLSEITSFENTSVTDIINVQLTLQNDVFNFDNDVSAKAKIHIDNIFGDVCGLMFSAAFYDDENRLLCIETDSSEKCGFTVTDNEITINKIPKNAVTARIFAWDGMRSLSAAKIVNKAKENIDLYLIGDSTCFTYDETNSNGNIQQGWGCYINEYFDNVTVHNNAACGATAEFYNNYLWNSTLNEMKPEDYLFVCFSINDNAAAVKDRAGTYKRYVQGFIDDAKAKGVNIVLLTEQPTQIDRYNELENITRAVKELAAKNDVPCLDLNKKSVEHFNAMGFEATKNSYYLSTSAAERLGADNNFHEDFVHLNLDGARLLSEMIVELLTESDCPLRAYVNDKPRTKLNDTPESYGLN